MVSFFFFFFPVGTAVLLRKEGAKLPRLSQAGGGGGGMLTEGTKNSITRCLTASRGFREEVCPSSFFFFRRRGHFSYHSLLYFFVRNKMVYVTSDNL